WKTDFARSIPSVVTLSMDDSLCWPFHSTQHGTLRCRKREPSTPSMARHGSFFDEPKPHGFGHFFGPVAVMPSLAREELGGFF
ncbi:MAG: hypothetical protein JJU08_13130, partial [Rhodobacteraceae bacterium]|nr:hypothetical protein [Paracoccaceae bacterium]